MFRKIHIAWLQVHLMQRFNRKNNIELTLYKYVLMFHATKDLQNKIYFCPPPPKKKVKTRNERGKRVLRDEIIVRRGLIVEVK